VRFEVLTAVLLGIHLVWKVTQWLWGSGRIFFNPTYHGDVLWSQVNLKQSGSIQDWGFRSSFLTYSWQVVCRDLPLSNTKPAPHCCLHPSHKRNFQSGSATFNRLLALGVKNYSFVCTNLGHNEVPSVMCDVSFILLSVCTAWCVPMSSKLFIKW
jgi:hypothetical protein